MSYLNTFTKQIITQLVFPGKRSVVRGVVRCCAVMRSCAELCGDEELCGLVRCCAVISKCVVIWNVWSVKCSVVNIGMSRPMKARLCPCGSTWMFDCYFTWLLPWQQWRIKYFCGLAKFTCSCCVGIGLSTMIRLLESWFDTYWVTFIITKLIKHIMENILTKPAPRQISSLSMNNLWQFAVFAWHQIIWNSFRIANCNSSLPRKLITF